MYPSRQPITSSYFAANEAAIIANPKPLVSGTGEHRREMSTAIMGEWLRARPGVTDKDIAKEFTSTERERFLDGAIDYAIRNSGGAH